MHEQVAIIVAEWGELCNEIDELRMKNKEWGVGNKIWVCKVLKVYKVYNVLSLRASIVFNVCVAIFSDFEI